LAVFYLSMLDSSPGEGFGNHLKQ